MKILPVLFTLLFFIAPAHALTMEEASGEPTLNIEDYIEDFVDVPKGGTDWKLLGTTQTIEVRAKTEEGYDNHYNQPIFQPEVTALDGKEMKIKGYMFPLDEAEKQKLFLFGPFPLSCPFQYHVGPSLVIEVRAYAHPVTFNYEAVTLKGTLELVPDDPEYGVFYRLKNAKIVK